MMQTLIPRRVIRSCIIHSVSTDPRTLSNCHLEVGNGNEYPEIHHTPTADMTRVYRDVLKYVHKGNEYGEGHYLIKLILVPCLPFHVFT